MKKPFLVLSNIIEGEEKKNMLVKDKIKEFKDILTKLVNNINNKRKYQAHDILVPILIIAGSVIRNTIEYSKKKSYEDLGFNETVYRHFISLNDNIQNNIIEYLIKDIETSNITKTKPTRSKIIKTIADEYYITDAAISNLLEKNYLIFITSFIVLLLKSVIYNTFSNKELKTGLEKDVYLKHRVSKIEDDLEEFKRIVKSYE